MKLDQGLYIEGQFSTSCDIRSHSAHTGSGRGTKFTTSVVHKLEITHAWFQACSYYGLVSCPDPTLCEGKGIWTIFLVWLARSATAVLKQTLDLIGQ